MDIKDNKKMYIICRNDLSSSYKMVQGAHALAKYAIEYPKEFKKWNNGYLIFLAVPNLKALEDSCLSFCYCNASYFREVDLYLQLTAIAYYGEGDFLSNLPLA
jgi:hypothetical protein